MNYTGYPAPSYPNYNAMNMGQQMYPQRQEVVRVNGQNGANAYQMAPNSSILLLDETAPIIWLKTTDGASYPTVTGYTITPIETQTTNIADAKYLECLIADVSDELAQANSLYIKKKSTDFDIESIMGDQEEKAEKYWQKITEIWR